MITLATLQTATEQEVFDQVANHLLKQSKKSVAADGDECQYLSHDGLRCAAGCLIGDGEYRKAWEGVTWADLVAQGSVTYAHEDLICRLQALHDCTDSDVWPDMLQELAESKGLKFNHPKDSK